MVTTDPIADLFTRIRNALMVFKESVNIPYSNLKFNIVKLLKEEGYINDYYIVEEKEENKRNLQIKLAYNEEGKSVISKIERKSRPGKRFYIQK